MSTRHDEIVAAQARIAELEEELRFLQSPSSAAQSLRLTIISLAVGGVTLVGVLVFLFGIPRGAWRADARAHIAAGVNPAIPAQVRNAR